MIEAFPSRVVKTRTGLPVGPTYMLADRLPGPVEAFNAARAALARAERKGVMNFALHVECRRGEYLVYASLLSDRRDSLEDQQAELRKLRGPAGP